MPKILKKIIPKNLLIQKISNKTNSLYLTFDDGPNPKVTPNILKLLDQFNAKAVFFIPGRRIKNAPDLLKQIIDRGHDIGNHSFIHSNHKQPAFFHYLKDIKKCQDEIKKTCGIEPMLFRPPTGIVSFTTLFTPKLIGLKTITWSLDSQDWKCKSTADALKSADLILKKAQPGDIILLHDDNSYVETILEIILPVFVKHKYHLNHKY